MIRTNNLGMTFIEMIVVVLIVGILSVSIVLSVGVINTPKPMDSAKRIESVLDKTRLETMSRVDKNIVATLFTEGEKYFISITEQGVTPSSTDAKAVQVGGSDLEISVNGETIGENPVEISFDKGTGSFVDNEELFHGKSAEILIKGTKEVKVILVQLTGNSYIE